MSERAVEDDVSVWPEQLRGWNRSSQAGGSDPGFGEASRVETVPTEQRALVSKLEMGFLSGCVQTVVLVLCP